MSERNCNRISFFAAVLLAAGIIAGILVPAGPGWDFANFYDAGHKVLAGQIQDLYNPEVLIGGKAPEGQLAYYGAPVTALLFAPMALLPPSQAMVAFKFEGTAAILIGLWLLYAYNLRFAEKSGLGRVRYRAAFVSAAVLFQPFWTIYRVGGQTTPTLFLGFVLAFLWLISGRFFAASLILVAVVAIKPAFSLTLILLALILGSRFLAYTAAAGITTAALSMLMMGWTIHQRFLEHVGAGKVSAWPYNSSISVVFENLRLLPGASSPLLTAASTVTRLIAAGLVLAVLVRGRRRIGPATAQRHFIFLMSIVFGLLLMPVVWEHYLSVLFIPAAYFIAMLPHLGRPARKLLLLFGSFCLTQNMILMLWLRERLHSYSALELIGMGVLKSAPLILFTMLLWRHRRQLVSTYVGATETMVGRTAAGAIPTGTRSGELRAEV